MSPKQIKEKVLLDLEVINPDNTKATDDEKFKARLFIREIYMIVCATSASDHSKSKGEFLLGLIQTTSKDFTHDEKIKAWLFLKETLALIYK